MSFRASAPAKLILFGEHAVVYGHQCVATALDNLRIHAVIEPTSANNTLELVFTGLQPSLPVSRHHITLETLHNVILDHMESHHYQPVPTDALLARLRTLLQQELNFVSNENHLLSTLFLLCAFLRSKKIASNSEGLRVHVWPEDSFPIGAGLGSSGAFCVALSGALACYIGVNDTERINSYAFAAEVLTHGTPSGVDNTISTFGGTLVYQKTPKVEYKKLSDYLSPFRFLIVNTGVSRSTKMVVNGVFEAYQADPVRFKERFMAIQEIVDEFLQLALDGKLTDVAIANLFRRNQVVLDQIGVGHPKIERVISILEKYQIGSKLTGAGAGGCVVGILPAQLTQVDVQSVVEAITAEKFQCFVSTIGGKGLIFE